MRTNTIGKPIITDIIQSLELNGVKCKTVPHCSYTLTHSLNEQEFNELIVDICEHHQLKPQNPDWFPGSPTGDDEDIGYYVCPITPDKNEGDFDMCISLTEIQYC